MEYGQPRGQQRGKRELTPWDKLPTADKVAALEEKNRMKSEALTADPAAAKLHGEIGLYQKTDAQRREEALEKLNNLFKKPTEKTN